MFTLHETELDRQSLFGARSGRDIERYDAEIAEPRFQITALRVDVGNADAGNHAVGFFAAVDTHAAVARPFGAMEIAVESVRIADSRGEILVLGLELLHADDVRALFREPAEEAFIDGGTYAV